MTGTQIDQLLNGAIAQPIAAALVVMAVVLLVIAVTGFFLARLFVRQNQALATQQEAIAKVVAGLSESNNKLQSDARQDVRDFRDQAAAYNVALGKLVEQVGLQNDNQKQALSQEAERSKTSSAELEKMRSLIADTNGNINRMVDASTNGYAQILDRVIQVNKDTAERTALGVDTLKGQLEQLEAKIDERFSALDKKVNDLAAMENRLLGLIETLAVAKTTPDQAAQPPTSMTAHIS